MANNALEEVLSRLNIKGATSIGGANYARHAVVTDDVTGLIDGSLFTSTLSTYEVANEGALPLTALNGEIAVVTNTAAYVYDENLNGGDWRLISYLDAGVNPYNPATTALVSTTVQNAITELATRTVFLDTDTEVTAQVTFNVAGGEAFLVDAASRNFVIANLNSELVGGYTAVALRDRTNHTGYLPSTGLNPQVIYPISISGSAATANSATTAASAAYATTAGALTGPAAQAISANTATTATNATNILDGVTQRNISYLRNISNVNAGTLPAGRFDATSHGNLAGGTLHAIAIPDNNVVIVNGEIVSSSGGTPGFISSADAYKIGTLTLGQYVLKSDPKSTMSIANIDAAGNDTLVTKEWVLAQLA